MAEQEFVRQQKVVKDFLYTHIDRELNVDI